MSLVTPYFAANKRLFKSLRKKSSYPVFFWSVFSRIRAKYLRNKSPYPNTEKFRILTLFMQWVMPKNFY